MTTGVAYWHVCMHWLLQSLLGLRFADVISEDGPAWLPASTACLQGKHEGLCMAGKSFPFLIGTPSHLWTGMTAVMP